MRKIYSIMLMAAALLISTNVKANTYTEATDFLTDWEDVVNGDEFALAAPITITSQLVLDLENGGNVTLDLGGKTLTMNAPTNPAILVKHGVLTIKNGTIKNSNNKSIDLIRVVGTTATGYDAENGNVYSQVIVESNANIDNTVTSGDTKFNAMTITEVGSGANAYSNGARIDLKGRIDATTYGIKVNGTIQKPTVKADAPYVHIYSTATIVAGNNKKAVAAYAAGYAHWLIEGTCTGATGVYVKSGDVDITGATISSNYTGDWDKIDNTSSSSGVTGAGSAVAVESNQNYSGHIEVTIDGGSSLTAGTGYALEENVSNNTGNVSTSDVKVEAVTVEDATFSQGTSGTGAIIISEKTTEVATAAAQDQTEGNEIIVVTQAEVTGTVTIAGSSSTEENPAHTLNDFTTTSAYFDPTKDEDNTNDNDPIVVIPLTVTPNAAGYTTYSAPIDLYLPATGLTAYVGAVSDEVLELSPVNYIKKNEGVILAGTAGTNYTLTSNKPNALTHCDYPVNQLKAASTWVNGQAQDNAYVLVGGELWKYTGTEMKLNKAYLKLNGPATQYGAPKRIQLVVTETEGTQAVDNVETTIEAVKFMENGQIYIRRGENIYNVQGQIVK